MRLKLTLSYEFNLNKDSSEPTATVNHSKIKREQSFGREALPFQTTSMI